MPPESPSTAFFHPHLVDLLPDKADEDLPQQIRIHRKPAHRFRSFPIRFSSLRVMKRFSSRIMGEEIRSLRSVSPLTPATRKSSSRMAPRAVTAPDGST